MEKVNVFVSFTGEVFFNDEKCRIRDKEYQKALEDADCLLSAFENQCLNHDVGHCGPLDNDDNSEVSNFYKYKKKLIVAIALWKLLGCVIPRNASELKFLSLN